MVTPASIDFPDRRSRLRELVAKSRAGALDAVLLTALPNVRWACGYSGSNASLLLGLTDRTGLEDQSWLVTDGRYLARAARECPGVHLIDDHATLPRALAEAVRSGMRRVGLEARHVSRADWTELAATARSAGTDLVALDGEVESLRMVKDRVEVGLLRLAGQISCQALAELVPRVRPGISELVLARRLELLMAQDGAHDRAFPTIVATGPNSAIPHHEPTSRTVAAGDLLKIDFGAQVCGYHADITRTFVVGAEPAAWQRDLHALVLTAQAAGRSALRAGATTAAVDAAARDVIVAAGFGPRFTHGLGHGIGLEIHEAPMFTRTGTAILGVGVAATIEPGVYLPEEGGVRIEDSCVVTAGGAAVLTPAPYDLIRLG